MATASIVPMLCVHHGNDGYWNNGNALYLARIPKAKLPNLNPSDIAYYVGGDGNSDAAWTHQSGEFSRFCRPMAA